MSWQLSTFHDTLFIVDNVLNPVELNVAKIWAVQLLSYLKIWVKKKAGK